MKITGAEITVKVLLEQKINLVFGYPGGQVLDIYESLYKHRNRIKHILTAHEQGASHAADGYARSTGKVGVVIATSGPGATNLVTGIAAAYMDSVPMVAITGNVPTSQIGTDSFQEVDITGITMPITKHNFFVDKVDKLAETLRNAFRLAMSGRPGPVLVDIPKDVQVALCKYVPENPVEKDEPFAAKDIRINEASEIINSSLRPFIYFGGGIISSGAADELLELADKIDAPLGCSMMGLSCVPSSNPRFLGMQGMHGRYASTMCMNKADVIIALGVRFNDRSTNDRLKFAPNSKVVHIDIDGSELSKTVNDTCSLRGDLKLTLQKLLPLVEKKENSSWMETAKKLKNEEEKILTVISEEKITSVQLFSEINRFLDDDILVATDVGQHQVWAAQYLKFSCRRQFISNGGLGAMGYGMGAAIGASLATGKKTILITGDGSFGMNLNELATAVSYKLPILIVILNNRTLGMVRQYQTMFYNKHYSATDINRKTDFVEVAKAFGADGVRVREEKELKAFLSKYLKPKHTFTKPVVVECLIDKDEAVFPMLKPGGSTEDIILCYNQNYT